jgi:hypothetical protein
LSPMAKSTSAANIKSPKALPKSSMVVSPLPPAKVEGTRVYAII